MRRRLREKFLSQEGVALSDSFSLAYMIPAVPGKGRHTHSSSLSSARTFSDAALEKIASEDDWGVVGRREAHAACYGHLFMIRDSDSDPHA
jgi:hypothetical protein